MPGEDLENLIKPGILKKAEGNLKKTGILKNA